MQDWKYETAEDIDQSVIERLQRVPREPDLFVYSLRLIAAGLIRVWMRVYHRLTITGRENLPNNGSYVLIANHTSHLDTISILSGLPIQSLHRVFPAAAKDFFFVSVPRVAFSAVMVNALPFDRHTNIRQSLSLCTRLLDRPNTILLIFPEGTRSPTGEMSDFKPGIGYLLAGNDVPVIPCRIEGAFEALPKGRFIPSPKRVRIMIGKPRHYSHLKRGKSAVVDICNDLQNSVSALASVDSTQATSIAAPEDHV